MAFDGIIAKSVINELNSCLIEGKINKVFQPNKNELILGIYSKGKNYALNICIDSSNCRINLTTHTKPNPLNALNFCMFLRKHIIGYRIKNIYSIDLERIIFIDLEGYNELNDLTKQTIIVELMGKHSNVILINDKKTIIDSMRHLDSFSNSNRDIMPAREYVYPTSTKKSFLSIKNFNEFYNIIKNSSSNELTKCICNSFIGFSTSFVKSALSIVNIENNDFSNNSLESLYNYFKKIINNIDTVSLNTINIETGLFLSSSTTNKIDYVVCKEIKRNFLDVNFFIDDFYYKKNQNEIFISYRNSILKLILSYLKKYKTRLNNINKKLKECNNKEIFQLYGELITSNLYRIKNTKEDNIVLENYYDNNNLITIPLDKKFSVSDNAKRYFKKYNKLKNALEICSLQKQETESELNYIESIIYELENSNTVEDIDNIYSEISENNIFKDSFKNKSNKVTKNNKIKESLLPNKIELEGYTIYIGKNNLCNDYLTTKLSPKTDLWFHTKDIHGSHVVLKLTDKEPTKNIITKCAQIAAYHSKAKLSSNVPVDYCYIKYVKKPSKAKPGMVIYTHNKTLYVEPKNF